MDGANPVKTPAEGEKPWLQEEDECPLSGKEETKYRALAARANYLAVDRADIQFATKEICRAMATPTTTTPVDIPMISSSPEKVGMSDVLKMSFLAYLPITDAAPLKTPKFSWFRGLHGCG